MNIGSTASVTVIHHYGGDHVCRNLTSTLGMPNLRRSRLLSIGTGTGVSSNPIARRSRLRGCPRRPLATHCAGSCRSRARCRSRVHLERVRVCSNRQPAFRPFGPLFRAWKIMMLSVGTMTGSVRVPRAYRRWRTKSNPRSWYGRSRSRVATTLCQPLQAYPFCSWSGKSRRTNRGTMIFGFGRKFLIWWGRSFQRPRHAGLPALH